MDFKIIENMYKRLEELSIKIEPYSIPNPRYISEKIGECHLCIEEVEKFYIQISREMSVLQRVLNNAEALYIAKKDELLSHDPEISTIPGSIKDREARANTRLKSELNEIKDYKNQFSDLEKVFSAINVKLKNLGRANSDIKLQLRLMESQIKLGSGGINDPATKDLMEELKNTAIGKDMWEDAETKSEENKTFDPTKPIEPEDIDPLAMLENTVNQMVAQKEEDLVPEINTLSKDEVKPVDEMEQPQDEHSEFITDYEKSFPEDDVLESISSSGEETVEHRSSPIIDLDKILTPQDNSVETIPTPLIATGGETPTNKSKSDESETKVTQTRPQAQDPNEMDFSKLLSQFN